MKVVCPTCGAPSTLEAMLNDADQRQFAAIMAELPRTVAAIAPHYIGLFRPMGGRGLVWKRALRLIIEVRAMADMTTVQWGNGVARPLTPQMLGMAMERMIARPPRRLPLTNHNYLRSIVYEIADDADRGAEKAHVAAERSGSIRANLENSEDAAPIVEIIDREWLKQVKNKNMKKPAKNVDAGNDEGGA